jgi:serine/threonine-protein kinase
VRGEATTRQIPTDLSRTRGRGSLADLPPNSLPPNSSVVRPGEIVAGKYQVVHPIAHGGMGQVWLAVHESLKTEVAIKLSSASVYSDPERYATILERFMFEARISARLGARTKHIVAVLDAGTHNGVPYLVMEYVRGRTLDEELSEKGRLSPERLAHVLDQMADALDVAHNLGVIHRDIKPANVMIADDSHRGMVKVADFGVAKVVRQDLSLEQPRATPVNAIIGSPAYMSPEQMRAGDRSIDLRSDLWSLGVLAYEALTGKLPFDGKTVADLIVAISTLTPTPLSSMRSDLGEPFDEWLDRALAKEPAHRFSSARAMASAFRDAMAANIRRSPRMLILGAVIAAAIGSITAFIVFKGSQASAPPPPPPSSVQPLETPSPIAPSPNPEVQPVGPVTATLSSGPAPVVAPPPSARATATAQPTSSADAVKATSSAVPSAKPPKPERPRNKEIDPSEIQ